MYTPVNPSFTILKWGVRGSTFHGYISMMPRCNACLILYVCARFGSVVKSVRLLFLAILHVDEKLN